MKNFILLLLCVFLHSSGFTQKTAAEFYDLGKSLQKEKKLQEAITAFKKAISLNDKYTDALFELGWSYNSLAMYTEAIEPLKKELAAGPFILWQTNFEIGYAYKGLKKYTDALIYFNRAVAVSPGEPNPYYHRGYTHYYRKNYDSAVIDFNKYISLSINITDPGFYYDKAYAENESKQHGEAVKSLMKSIEIKNNYSTAWAELGYSYYKLNLNNEAINSYRTASTLYQDTAYRPLAGLGDVYFDNLKNYDSALLYFWKAVKFRTNNKIAFYKLGYSYNHKGQFAEGATALAQAILIDPEYKIARTELGYSYYRLGQYDNALSQLRPVIAKDPKDEVSRYYAGFCYSMQKDQVNLKKMIDELQVLNSTKYVETLKKYVTR